MKFWPWNLHTAALKTEEDILKQYGQALVIPIPQSLDWVLDSVTKAPPLELAGLDKKVRERSEYLPPDPLWPRISAEELERILKTPDISPVLLGLVSFHLSGYMRELAVQRLSEIKTGSELPFLLLRLNDWVLPVYQLALTAVQDRIVPDYAAALVHNISLEFELARQTRREHEPILCAIQVLLKKLECDAALKQGMNAPDKTTRRLCFAILEEADDDRLPVSIPQRLADPDPVIRLSAARLARIKLSEKTLRQLLPTMQQDTFMPVRREALYACVERLPDLALAALTAALLDINAGIRGIARYHLRQSQDFDLSAFYRQALAGASSSLVLCAALSGLGETGLANDSALVLPYLSYPLAKVRRAAVRAVSKLDGDKRIDVLLSALADDRPSVTHEAREALRPRLGLVDQGTLWRLFQENTSAHVRLDALALLAALPKWEKIPFLIEAASENDTLIQRQAAKHIQVWLSNYNSSFAKPTAAQVRRLEEALRINPDSNLAIVVSDWKTKMRLKD